MSYHEDGYQHLPLVFTGEMLADLQRTFDACRLKEHTWQGPWLQPGQKLRTNTSLHRDPVWAQAITILTPMIEGLIGPCRCSASMALLKPAGIGQPFPWHQDGAYYGDTKTSYVLAQVYLDDVTMDNGSLQVIPQTHTTGLRTHEYHGTMKKFLPDETGAGAVTVPAHAGDVVLMHLHLVHGSQPNLSDRPRRAVRLVFQQ